MFREVTARRSDKDWASRGEKKAVKVGWDEGWIVSRDEPAAKK